MARKELRYTVSAEGRDKGKVFVLTEMSARRGHAWATRALFAVMNGGVDLGDGLIGAGFAGLAAVGIKALGNISVNVGAPLMDELFSCVVIMPDPSKPQVTRPLIDDDTEEVATLFLLQKEVLGLHIDFFTSAKPLISA